MCEFVVVEIVEWVGVWLVHLVSWCRWLCGRRWPFVVVVIEVVDWVGVGQVEVYDRDIVIF